MRDSPGIYIKDIRGQCVLKISCNPDICPDDIDIDGITPGRIIGIQLMCDIALGSERESKYYYEEFKKRYNAKNQ